jgi:hypothetical protein
MAAERYPQGLKKNPIVLSNAAGKPVRKFNSYREAIDYNDAMKATNNAYDPHYQERWANDAQKKASNAQALAEGFKAPKIGGFTDSDLGSPTQGKINALSGAIRNRNQAWMGTQSTLPSLTKQIMVANNKRR